jgi:murein L,D-transpeptidase YafK
VSPSVISSSASSATQSASQVSASSSTAKVNPTIPADKQPLAPEAAKPKVQIPAASKDTPATSKVEEAAIQSALAVWAKAWSQKDMPRYLSAYADTFTPSEKMSRAKWESDRRLRIVSKKSISVGVSQVQISLQGQKATVRFQQIYESDSFKGISRKTLEMHKQGQRWLIVRETVN